MVFRNEYRCHVFILYDPVCQGLPIKQTDELCADHSKYIYITSLKASALHVKSTCQITALSELDVQLLIRFQQ